MTGPTILELGDRALAPVYRRPPVLFTHGQGAFLRTDGGDEYLDFTSGIAVTAFGHGAGIVERAAASGDGLVHVSNLYHTQPALELAIALTRHSFADRVFFANSGTEAVEGAVKFARLHAGSPEKREIVYFSGSFHGRTLGALSATDRDDIKDPFRPLAGEFRRLRFADMGDLELLGSRTAAAIVEPIQGESGVRVAPKDWLLALRRRCNEVGALLVFDEIQCGLGRTGRLWAHEESDVHPDLMTLAKPLAAGLPIGAVLMTEHVAGSVQPGSHGSTFGGGPVVCRAALEVLERVRQPEMLEEVVQKGERIRTRLASMTGIEEVRGRGLLLGVRTPFPAPEVVAAAFEQRLLLVPAGKEIVRLLPPFVVRDAEIDEGLGRLARTLQSMEPGKGTP